MLVRAEVDLDACKLVSRPRILVSRKLVPCACLWKLAVVGIEVTFFRISKLEQLSLIFELILLNLRTDPVWRELVDLLAPEDGLALDSIVVELC